MRYIKNIKWILPTLALMILSTGCGEKKFKIKGEISQGAGVSLILEKSDFNGQWTSIDSTKIGNNDKFSISFHSPASPDIYRLAIGDKYIYIPVDSTETILVTSTLNGFGKNFSLSGSRNAEALGEFEKELLSVHPDSLSGFKREVYSKYMKDFQGSILSYYILTKTLNGKPLYDAADNTDSKYFAAVATGFQSVRPNDPHTAILQQTALNSLKRRNVNQGKYLEITAEETSLIDIDLPDETGKNIKLSSLTGKGKPVVVIFSLLTHPDSPALNIELAKIYNKLDGKVEFYNVALDPDQYSWRDAAINIPWITVFAPGALNSEAALNYNVYELPSYFIYNTQGELSGRPNSLKDLENKLK